jgi:prepilin-type N-terminal cleavage/methylation domain-containing protein
LLFPAFAAKLKGAYSGSGDTGHAIFTSSTGSRRGDLVMSRSCAGNRRAFTLIEVLVVVAIIALLISILLPSLSLARAQAKAVACQSGLRQLTVALRMYSGDSKGYMPATLWSEYDWFAWKEDLWFYKLDRRYVMDPRIYICPADPFGGEFNYKALKPGLHKNAAVPSCGYGMNYLLRHFGEPKSFNIEYNRPKRPDNTILMAEVGPDDRLRNVPLGTNGGSQPWRDGGRIVWDDGARPWFSGPTWLTARHYGGINLAAMDLSIRRARTAHLLGPRIRPRYDDCARGDCYFCNYHAGSDATHYNFSGAKLWWWTGRAPRF